MTSKPEPLDAPEVSVGQAPTLELAESLVTTEPLAPKEPSAAPEAFAEPWFRTHPISGVLSGLILLAVLLVGGLRLVNRELGKDEPDFQILLIMSLLGLGLVLVVILVSVLVWRKTYFKVTGQYLFKSYRGRGRETVQIALASINGVDLNRNMLAKLLGLAELVVRPSAGDEVTLKYLTIEQANTLRFQILHPVTPASPHIEVSSSPLEEGTATTHSTHSGGSRSLDQGEQLYFLPVRIQVRALARQMLTVTLPAVISVAVIGVAALLMFKPDSSFWAFDFELRNIFSVVLRALILLFFAGFGLVKLVSKNYRSTLTHSGEELTSRRGLTSDTSTTIVLPQIHWLEIRQPFYWNRPDWWRLRVRAITTISEEDDDNDDASGAQVLMPIASREQLATVLGLLSQATRTSGTDTLAAAFRTIPLSVQTSKKARFFNPFAYGHEGLSMVGGTLLIRTGRWSTNLTVIPLTKFQGVSLTQGVLQRKLGLARLEIHGAGDVDDALVTNLDLADATLMFEALIEAARTPARKETVPSHELS